MKDLVTPKQVARAIDVSESSVKRWCDRGLIPTRYTAGGHRRIPVGGLLDFLRTTHHQLIDPAVLGLPVTTGRTHWSLDRAAGQLTESLLTGDEQSARQIVFDLYLGEFSLSSVFDCVMAEAFRSIGQKWEQGEAEVYQERRACEITLRILHELRRALPPLAPAAPLAIGGAPEGDQYNLATSMAELVLRANQWTAVSLGNNLPWPTLAAAIRRDRPRIFWLSCSHIEDPAAFLRGYQWLYSQLGHAASFAVGGHALGSAIRQQMKYDFYGDTMQHLEGFARSICEKQAM